MITPVFIGACDRSGTTMLGAMLGSHPQNLCIPESPFIVDVLQGTDFNIHNVDQRLVFDLWEKHPRFKTWGLALEALNSNRKERDMPYEDVISILIQAYADKQGKSPIKCWIDHTPSNTKHADILFRLFPNAKMIHLVRDGRSVAASLLRLPWGPNAIDKIAYFWLTNLVYGLAAESYYGPERIMRVYYEQLVLYPTTTLQGICTFANIEYHPEMAEGRGFDLPQFTRKQHALVGQPPDPIRISAWETQLSSRQVEIFEKVAGSTLESLGYTPQFGIRARGLTFRESVVSTLKLFQMFAGNWYTNYRVSRSSSKINLMS